MASQHEAEVQRSFINGLKLVDKASRADDTAGVFNSNSAHFLVENNNGQDMWFLECFDDLSNRLEEEELTIPQWLGAVSKDFLTLGRHGIFYAGKRLTAKRFDPSDSLSPVTSITIQEGNLRQGLSHLNVLVQRERYGKTDTLGGYSQRKAMLQGLASLTFKQLVRSGDLADFPVHEEVYTQGRAVINE
ncbi:MAG: hypothetical protein WAR37_00045 [Candidatus Microsaccharimonas sp.]